MPLGWILNTVATLEPVAGVEEGGGAAAGAGAGVGTAAGRTGAGAGTGLMLVITQHAVFPSRDTRLAEKLA